MPYFNLLLTLILMLAVAIVAAQNPTEVVVRFFSLQSVALPLGLLLIFSACLGAITMAMGFLFWFKRRPLSVAEQQLQERMQALEDLEPAQPDPPTETQE